jgi:hypothetical protein
MIAASSFATFGAVSALLVASPVHVTATAATHKPKINAHWSYTVKVTSAGKPTSGKITVQIVDPLGGVHAVQFGAKAKNITNIPFKGTFSDYMIFPAAGRGIPLTIRFTIHVGSAKKVVGYSVTPGG